MLPVIRINRNNINATVVCSVAYNFFLAFYDEYNLAIDYEKPIPTNLVEFIAGDFKIDN